MDFYHFRGVLWQIRDTCYCCKTLTSWILQNMRPLNQRGKKPQQFLSWYPLPSCSLEKLFLINDSKADMIIKMNKAVGRWSKHPCSESTRAPDCSAHTCHFIKPHMCVFLRPDRVKSISSTAWPWRACPSFFFFFINLPYWSGGLTVKRTRVWLPRTPRMINAGRLHCIKIKTVILGGINFQLIPAAVTNAPPHPLLCQTTTTPLFFLPC